MRGDMIQVWKFLHDERYGGNKYFRMVEDQHVRHSRHNSKPLNIYRPDAKLEVRRNCSTVGCMDKWNRLPHQVQNAANLITFENDNDKFFKQRN